MPVDSHVDSVVPLLGYSDRLSARPGETISFKVSSIASTPFDARLTRSISADPNPAGPGLVEEEVERFFPRCSFPSRHQPFFPGSYALSEKALELSSADGFVIGATVFPTLAKRSAQTILSIAGFALFIDGDGAAAVRFGDSLVSAPEPLTLRRWYRLEAIYDPLGKRLRLRRSPLPGPRHEPIETSTEVDAPADTIVGHVAIAARLSDEGASEHYNGKIERPAIHRGTRALEENRIAEWDLAKDTSTILVRDLGPRALDARLVNFPTRAVTGSRWDASEICWRHAPEHYAAIHFHDDDIYDFGWEDDFAFTVPDDMPSGVYVMRIRCGPHEDAMPFYVCPPRGTARARTCLLVPTFTYVVYGNHARPDFEPSWKARIESWNAYPYNPAEYRHYGLSTYNVHSDGSGICHASHRRPLFNLRPGYLTFGKGEGSGLRHFQADSHLIAWLHAKAIEHDLITDHELHAEGLSALEAYDTLLTTTHPEYHTTETLDALERFRDGGGHLLYLGGNGFYWRVARHRQAEDMIEIRRAEDGIRAWAAEPGEYFNAFDGTYGGLWRRSGRPPQRLVGVGFSAQGEFNGSYYERQCHDPAFDWIFEGVEGDVLGNFGLSGGGAAGFELDRADRHLGTPDDAVVLASSRGHGEDFVLVPEEQLTHLTNLPGEPTASLLRADMVYFEVAGGGSVFSVGSITFCGSLPWNGFDNDISTLLENVVRRRSAGE